jgi:hypothetical protein
MLPELDADVICVQEGAATASIASFNVGRPAAHALRRVVCACAANMEWIEEMTDNEYVQQNYFASDVNGRTFNGSLLSSPLLAPPLLATPIDAHNRSTSLGTVW